MAGEENLIPFQDRSEGEARELGRIGGIKSGEARREKRLLSQVLGELMIEKSGIDIDGKMQELEGEAFLKEVARRVLRKSDAAAVSLLKLMIESDEGKKIKAELAGPGGGAILTHGLTTEEAEEFKRRMAELHPLIGKPKTE